MIRDLLKWVVPGLVTVLAGSTLSLAMTSPDIERDVIGQTSATAARAGFDWAELSFAMRDVTLSGTTTDQAYVDAAVQRIAMIPGVRSVKTNVTLAPLASPYRLEASIDGGTVSLAGGVPDETTRQLLLNRAKIEQGALELRSGMPERQLWVAGAQFAIDQLRFFDEGGARISDLKVDISGRAKSARDFRDLLIALRAGAPAGVTLGEVEITPALVSPYQWSAISDGRRIEVSGFVPDENLVERYRSAETGGKSVATGLALASGEPSGFAEVSQKLIEQLSRLEYGTASIVDGQSTLTGAPPTFEVAQAVMEQLQGAGSIIELEPPRVDDYWASATLQAGGELIFDGYAPDTATRDELKSVGGAQTDWLQLARGAPERYQSAMDFGLSALRRMSEGRFSLRQNVLSLSGVARSGEDYQALIKTIAEDAPQGFVLARAEIDAPVAADYQWSVRKNAAGELSLSGMVPNAPAKSSLVTAAGSSVSADLAFASGEPRNFVASAETGILLLEWLANGEVVFDGSGWTITGTAKSEIDKAAIEADFVSRKLAGAGWSMSIAAPVPVIPVAEPYTWSATSTGADVTLTGYVPDADARLRFSSKAQNSADTTQVASGAPVGFVVSAEAALDAVMAIGDAEARFDGANWSLAGRATSVEVRDAALAALESTTDVTSWSIAVEAPEPGPTQPYLWSATKTPDGAVTVEGLVPADELKRVVAMRVGEGLNDLTVIDPPAPDGFPLDVLAAIDSLSRLSDGFVSFDGTQWRIDGNLLDAEGASAIDTALAGAATPANAWQLTLLEPVVPAAQVEPEAPIEPEFDAATATAQEPALVSSVDPDYAFSASRAEDGSFILSGQVPSDEALSQIAGITDGDTAEVSIADGAPEGFLTSAKIGLGALSLLTSGQLDLIDGTWRLTGAADDTTERDGVLDAIAAEEAATWSADIAAPEPVLDEPVAAVQPVATPAADKVDISACVGPIADFSGRNAILFQSGAALIANESEIALDELVIILAECPDALIRIEGHTDADGDARLNLGLSVARAEAVVTALVERGIDPQRLYALGYGETKPIADNGTSAGKRLNRRIVVTVSDEHF
ncbi:OmpA family protein [Devosia neptuniae]|uniref:OmpA family protein n=4 Tax=Devosia TaxID=46913 RepID=UPI0022AFA9DD|nr:OmpA family protein [Devosia neptuniae]MCZ4346117.1 OmpA family protein [Devosia neptuniae]